MVFLDGLAKVVCVFFFYCCFMHVWLILDWNDMPCAFRPCALEMNINNRFKRLYVHYHNAYGHQTCQIDDIPQWALSHKFARGIFKSPDKLNTSNLHFQETYGNHTRQYPELLWEAPMFKVISPFDYGTIASSACKTEKNLSPLS